MKMRTRTSATAASNGETAVEKDDVKKQPGKPLKTLILPSNASDGARFVTLENPATGKPNAYYFCPKIGLNEFTTIGGSSSATRSILFTPSSPGSLPISADAQKKQSSHEEEGERGYSTSPQHDGHISKVAELHVATPVDIVFFLLPILAPKALNRTQAQKLLQPLDDILDAEENLSGHLRNILTKNYFRETVERRMAAVCDTVEAGETMFRLNMDKVVRELLSKAENAAANGLPASMEERFIRRELEIPVLSISRENPSGTADPAETPTQNNVRAGASTAEEGVDSQQSNGSASTSNGTTTNASSASTPATSVTTPEESQESELANGEGKSLRDLLRIRTALSFILSSYVPAHLRTEIENSLKLSGSPQDFTPLTAHLKHVSDLRVKAQESRSMYDMTRKRGLEDEDEAAVSRAEKRRKEDEEKKRKASESRGLRDLKKVNTSKMKPLSAFFGKK